jgi:hypothetical protein
MCAGLGGPSIAPDMDSTSSQTGMPPALRPQFVRTGFPSRALTTTRSTRLTCPVVAGLLADSFQPPFLAVAFR